MGFCFTCGGEGFPDKVCPECGKEPARAVETTPVYLGNGTIDIPPQYRGVYWNSEHLEMDFRKKVPEKFGMSGATDYGFVQYVRQLDKIHGIFQEGKIPQKSAIIIAPAGYSKMTFAYSCMQMASNAGFSVAPMLDTLELKRLLILAADNVKYKLFDKLSYDDYIMSDVVFVTVSKTYARYDAFTIIQELLDKRGRRGLASFIISRWDLKDLTKDMDTLIAYGSGKSSDRAKYPVRIFYKPLGGAYGNNN